MATRPQYAPDGADSDDEIRYLRQPGMMDPGQESETLAQGAGDDLDVGRVAARIGWERIHSAASQFGFRPADQTVTQCSLPPRQRLLQGEQAPRPGRDVRLTALSGWPGPITALGFGSRRYTPSRGARYERGSACSPGPQEIEAGIRVWQNRATWIDGPENCMRLMDGLRPREACAQTRAH